MTPYRSAFRTSTLIVRLFITALSVILVLTGVLAAIGMFLNQASDTTALVFVLLTVSVGFLIFKASAWNIRRYLIYEDRLEVRVLGGIRTFVYPKGTLVAFNDLRAMITDQTPGIGIVTTEHRMIKIVEFDLDHFAEFISQLQTIVRWDLTLKYDAQAR